MLLPKVYDKVRKSSLNVLINNSVLILSLKDEWFQLSSIQQFILSFLFNI